MAALWFHLIDQSVLVTKFSDTDEKIIPFFDKYRIDGVKALDYADFKKVAKMIKVKEHLTKKGITEIIRIKDGMNTGRLH